MQSKISKWKRNMGWSLREPGSSFQESAPSRITQDMLNSPSRGLLPHVWNVFYQRRSPEPSWQSFYCSHFVGTFCFSTYRISDSQRESRGSSQTTVFVQTAEVQCATLMSVGIVGTISKAKLPDANL